MEETKGREIEIRLKDLVVVFVRVWWILLIVGIVVCGGLYGILKKTHVNQYTATATVYINRPSGTLQAAQVSISNALVGDYVKLVTMDKTLDVVRATLGITPEALPDATFEKMISVTNSSDNRWIELSVTAEEPQDAVDLVDALAKTSVYSFNEELLGGENYSKYYNTVDTENPENSVRISNPISKTKIILIGTAVCLVVYLVFFLLYAMDDKINTPEDVEKYLGLNILGQIPYRHGSHKGKKYAADTAAKGDQA